MAQYANHRRLPKACSGLAALRWAIAISAFCGLSAGPTSTAAASADAAAVLAGSCANCHGPDGRSPGSIPTIAGISYETLKAQLEAFKSDEVPDATVMPRLMRGFDAEQIDALARHFSNIQRQVP
ncbi:MAG: c-type cytochrome [Pseudaminobacter sp.]